MDASLERKSKQPGNGRAILIAGPTASGKSAFALEVAALCDGVIVNADSMQLYEDLLIVSARPSAEEEELVPHRLYGILPASTAFSTGAWLKRACAEIAGLRAKGKTPVVVGGTGLYFKGLTEGFAEMPEIPDDVRQAARDLGEREGADGLRAALARAGDDEAAAVLKDPQRLSRALEVIVATGKPLSVWQASAQTAPFLSTDESIRIVLAPPRSWLHARIEQRARRMLSEEGIGEVRALLEKGLPPQLPAMRAIGVAEIRDFLSGDQGFEDTVHRLTVATRQYAKRQETWFRNQMPDWQRVDPSKGIGAHEIAAQL
ncbi:MAG: tRNA (adenosine(37)-N6)-dimethylallyltransferase MiaA [Pseudomonadota bacterium]